MKYRFATSLAVIALLTSSAQAGKRSLIALAEEDDAIESGSSNRWSDVGYTMTKDESNIETEEDLNNTSLGNLAKAKKKEEKNEKAATIREEINQKENSD